jgi:vacuolar-type H+-ATPase subunit E/Vma4
MTAGRGTEALLAPARARMRREAADQAARILAEARREAAATIARAEQRGAAALAQARAAGQQEAAVLAAGIDSQAHREARTVLLSAQAAALDDLRTRVRAEVAALRGAPGFGQLHDRLTTMARQAAGPGAVVSSSPDGGVLARGAGVAVDCSLARLADLAVQALGPDVREVWTT